MSSEGRLLPDEQGFRILGVRASGGPLLDTPLLTSEGLTVLYGLNGAGKSRLLAALHAGLTGDREHLIATDAEFDVDVFIEAPQLAESVPLDVPWDDSSALTDFPGDPYRREDRARIVDAFFEAQASKLVAVSPHYLPGPGWVLRKAVLPSPGSSLAWLRDHDTAFIEWARWRSFELEPPIELTTLWGFRKNPDYPVDFSFDGMSFLHLATTHGALAEGEDPFLPIPDDGLPLIIGEPYSKGRGAPHGSSAGLNLNLRVITNSPITSIADDTLDAVRRAMWGVYATPTDGWQRHSRHVALNDERQSASVRDMLDDMGLSDREEFADVSVSAGGMSPIKHWLEFAAQIADGLLSLFLLDAPRLNVGFSESPEDVLSGAAVTWTANGGLPIEALSNAEKRWVAFAIRLALVATAQSGSGSGKEQPLPSVQDLKLPGATFLLLDEPETALHRTAEQHMAAGLAHLARMPGLHVIVATHSPELLNLPEATAMRIHTVTHQGVDCNEDGEFFPMERPVTRVSVLDAVSRQDLEILGLQPSDLLRRMRVILLVEGQHDEMVIEHVLGFDLARLRVSTIPLRGARNLPLTLDSRLLFDFTDALVVPVLDNVSARHLHDTWEQAQVLASTEGQQSARAFILNQLPAKESAENKFLSNFLTRAVDMGMESRVEPFGFGRRDILCYLPIEAFSKRVASWDEVLDRFQAAQDSGQTNLTNWKQWAARTLELSTDEATIRAALENWTEVPDDFALLRQLCNEASSPHRGRPSPEA